MKKKIGIIIYLLICSAVIGAGIYAGEKHPADCGFCKPGIEKYNGQSEKFAGVCK